MRNLSIYQPCDRKAEKDINEAWQYVAKKDECVNECKKIYIVTVRYRSSNISSLLGIGLVWIPCMSWSCIYYIICTKSSACE